MARESGEITNPFDDKREWMGRDIEKVEVYGSDIEDIERESEFERASDHRAAMLIGSAAVAAVAITSIVLIRRKWQRENNEEYTYPGEAEPEEKSIRPSRIQRLADRQKKRLSDTADDIIDALVGAACAKLVSVISDAVPDFRSEYERTSMTR